MLDEVLSAKTAYIIHQMSRVIEDFAFSHAMERKDALKPAQEAFEK